LVSAIDVNKPLIFTRKRFLLNEKDYDKAMHRAKKSRLRVSAPNKIKRKTWTVLSKNAGARRFGGYDLFTISKYNW